jgi:hypothetical protein
VAALHPSRDPGEGARGGGCAVPDQRDVLDHLPEPSPPPAPGGRRPDPGPDPTSISWTPPTGGSPP